jgi:hypothetical protein
LALHAEVRHLRARYSAAPLGLTGGDLTQEQPRLEDRPLRQLVLLVECADEVEFLRAKHGERRAP